LYLPTRPGVAAVPPPGGFVVSLKRKAMVTVDKNMEDLKFVFKEGQGFVGALLPLYQEMIKSMSMEERGKFFEGDTPLNNWQLTVILSYASILEKMVENRREKEGD